MVVRKAASPPGGKGLPVYVRGGAAPGGGAKADARASAFHRQLPGYARTPLLESAALAAACGVKQVLVKVETERFGLPSFKFMGASWAAYRMIEDRCGGLRPWSTLEDLGAQIRLPMRLITATDGNHGRAVAHLANKLGLPSRILLPKGAAQARIDAISAEGAVVEIVDGTYDDAVARAAAISVGDPDWLLVADTSESDAEPAPRHVIDGYETIMLEVEEQLADHGLGPPDVVLVQAGVGAFAAAVARHQWRTGNLPKLVVVEPEDAACVTASLITGSLVPVPGPHLSVMAGLNCGYPSVVAWPTLATSVDAALPVTDDDAHEAMRRFAEFGVVAGESGAAGLAGLLRIAQQPQLASLRDALSFGPHCTAMVFVTEGATDPENYERVTGQPHHVCAS